MAKEAGKLRINDRLIYKGRTLWIEEWKIESPPMGGGIIRVRARDDESEEVHHLTFPLDAMMEVR